MLEGEDPATTLSVDRTFPDPALGREMARLPSTCPNAACPWTGPFSDYLNHEDICEFTPRPCPFGCPQEGNQQHLKEAVVEHTRILLGRITQLESSRREIDTTRGERPGVEDIGARVDHLHAQVAELQQMTEQYEASGEGLAVITEKQTVLDDLVNVLYAEVEQTSVHLEQLETDAVQRREAVDSTQGRIRNLERSIAIQEVTLTEHDLRIQTLESASFNGI